MIGLKKEFASSTLESWIDQLKKDLKGEDFSKLLRHDSIEEIEYPTFHHAESNTITVESPGNSSFKRGLRTQSNAWNNGYVIHVTAEDQANKLALEVLMKGCDLLIFDFKKETFNWSTLFKEIQFEHIKVQLIVKTIGQYTALKSFFSNEFPATVSVLFDFLANAEDDDIADTILNDLQQKQTPTLFVDGYSIQQSGATTWQEIAFCISTGHEYLVRLMESGLTIDKAAACIQFSIGIGTNYFFEIAKIRALKQVWASVIHEYQPIHTCSYNCNLTAQIGFSNKSLIDPYTNLLRQTTEAMSAISGGVDNLVIQPYDSASENGTSMLAERMALNISLILKEESYFDKVIDPLGGSYAVEEITQKIAQKSWLLFQQFDKSGGVFKVETLNLLKKLIAEKRELRLEQVTNNEQTLIGINKFSNPKPEQNRFVETQHYLEIPNLIFERDIILVK